MGMKEGRRLFEQRFPKRQKDKPAKRLTLREMLDQKSDTSQEPERRSTKPPDQPQRRIR